VNFIPRYYEIEQVLRARVAALRPGDLVPSDAELCEEFGVSRMTARNAMQRLQQEGLVQRIPGRGTFVAERPVHRQAGSLISFTDEMRRRGRRPSSRVLRSLVRPATVDEAARLAVDRVVELVRLRLADADRRIDKFLTEIDIAIILFWDLSRFAELRDRKSTRLNSSHP